MHMDAGTTLRLGDELLGRALAKKQDPPPPQKKNSQPRIAKNSVCIHNWLTHNC